MGKSWTIISLVVTLSILAGCATPQQGAATGAAVGGVYGSILDQSNPWRGGVVGAALGAVIGATIGEISAQGARESVATGRPVEYRTMNGRAYYHAEPLEREPDTCPRVREKV